MKCIIRRIMLMLAAASKVLLILTLFFWVRSFWALDWIDGPQRAASWELLSDRGVIYFHRKFSFVAMPDRGGIELRAESNHENEASWAMYRWHAATVFGEKAWTRFAGFEYLHFNTERGHSIIFAAPYWSLAGMLALLPLWRWLAAHRDWRNKKRALARVCTTCGCGPQSPVQQCPECGGPVGRLDR